MTANQLNSPLLAHPEALTDAQIIGLWDRLAITHQNSARRIVGFAREVLAHAAPVPSASPADQTDYKAMFKDACLDLAAIHTSLGIPDDEAGGAEPILSAIEELKASSSPAALTAIREKLARFEECAGDDEGCDIGRRWFDALTTIGLLSRTQRSPATWSLTPTGEALLAVSPADPTGAEAEDFNPVEAIGVELARAEAGPNPRGVDILIEALDCTLHAHGFEVRPREADAPQPSAKALTDYSYQQLFDAIAAATHVSAGNVAVSVKNFRAALLAAEQPSEDKRDAEVWTRMGEGFPQLPGPCLVMFTEDNELELTTEYPMQASYREVTGKGFTYFDSWRGENISIDDQITHWMPMPARPATDASVANGEPQS
ncbi:hypothetical protein [Cupriavidus sp. YAF13]|uniref:hypothetical protein n=1 Tax=Cupriavidus sp. YAF13 TaxID=3233075 RepID=UPI003F8F9FDC